MTDLSDTPHQTAGAGPTKKERDRRVRQQATVWTMFAVLVPGAVVLMALVVGSGAVRQQQLDALRDALVDAAPMNPSPSLAGEVVFARGQASTGQVTVDEAMGVTLADQLLTFRKVEEWDTGRDSGWRDRDVVTFVATDARLGPWEIDAPVLEAANPYRVLVPLRAGLDYPVPAGWMLRGAPEADHVYQLVDAAERSDDPGDVEDGDRRLSYRTLPAGPVGVIAQVDGTGRRLVPMIVDGEPVSLIRPGNTEPSAMFAEETAWLDEDSGFAIGMGLLLAWIGFAFPFVWMRWSHWAVGMMVMAPGAALVLGFLTIRVAGTGTMAGGLLVGLAAAGLLIAPSIRRACRRHPPVPDPRP